MYEHDVSLLVCPKTGNPLELAHVSARGADGEIEEGILKEPGGRTYPIRNGIPRFVDTVEDNKTWDYKWTVLDAGRGLNYRIIDKNDDAYRIHDLFDRNGYDGAIYEHARSGLALDIGCGVGQYSVRLLSEFEPAKLIALDLTGGVDVFRKIVKERYPHLLPRLLIVQANVFEMPFRDASFDFIMSLGVLMHTGDTRRALGATFSKLKPGGHANLWIYCSENVAYSVSEKDRGYVHSMRNITPIQKKYRRAQWFIRLFRNHLPHSATVAFLRFMSSDFMYRLMSLRGWRIIHQWVPTVVHPNYDYRLINNYDGYVNKWSDSWSENEIFPVLRKHDIVIQDLGAWRLGIWGTKVPGFYEKR